MHAAAGAEWLLAPAAPTFLSRNPAIPAIVAQVQDVVLIALRILVRAPLLFVGSLIVDVATSPRLALILLILDPFVIGLLVWAVRRSRPLYAELQRRLDRLNTVIQENLAGVRLVKPFARADYERQQFGARNNSLMEQTISATRLVAEALGPEP